LFFGIIFLSRIKYKFKISIGNFFEFSFSFFIFSEIYLSLGKVKNNINLRLKVFNIDISYTNLNFLNRLFLNYENIMNNSNFMLKNVINLRNQLKFLNKLLIKLKSDRLSIFINILSNDLFILGFYFGLGTVVTHNIKNSSISINKIGDSINFNLFVKGRKILLIFIINILIGFFEYHFYNLFLFNFKLKKSDLYY
jgi:hypothetical protein